VTEDQDQRRHRRAGVFLGLLALSTTGVLAVVFATLAPATNTPPLRVNTTPDTVVVTAGQTARYDVELTRGSERGPVAFTVANLPAASSATFSPATTTGDGSTLVITTDGDDRDGTLTPAGTYDIVLRATGPDAVAGAVLRLKVQSQAAASLGDAVRISGSLATGLRPGTGAGIDLRLANPGRTAVRIDAVSVALAGVTAPRATAEHPCTLADFATVAYTGPALTLAPGATRTLSQLHVSAAQWPQVRMRNSSVNQDGCQTAVVTFTYGVEGQSA
jgi:hypothetical protein